MESVQHKSNNPPFAGREREHPPDEANTASGGIADIKLATAMSFSHGSGLLFLKDKHSKLSFLVDFGATLSILPCSYEAAPLGPKLIGANGTSIPT
jgi:hypothetical protein